MKEPKKQGYNEYKIDCIAKDRQLSIMKICCIKLKYLGQQQNQIIECESIIKLVMINKTKQISKPPKKYVPTQAQANTIISYFVHNNYQDFNTWQQISKSRCEFEFTQFKNYKFQCKATLKFDDLNMPLISELSISRSKKNSKKKALYKVINQLIYKGMIGFGFRDKDYIKKLPRRRKQSSEQENLQDSPSIEPPTIKEQSYQQINQLISQQKLNAAVQLVKFNNFESMWHHSILKADFTLCMKILRKLQGKLIQIGEQDRQFIKEQEQLFCQNLQEKWQPYIEKQLNNPQMDDLTDFLPSYQLQLTQNHMETEEPLITNGIVPAMDILPSQTLPKGRQGNNLFQFFYPIENTFSYLRNSQKSMKAQKKSNPFEDQLQLISNTVMIPSFDYEDEQKLIPYKIIDRLFEGILAHAYNPNLVSCLLNIMQRQVKECAIPICRSVSNLQINPIKYYLQAKSITVSEFSYMMSNKIKSSTLLSLEGFIVPPSPNQQIMLYNFKPTQEEQVLQTKLPTKKPQIYNTIEFEEVVEFLPSDYVLICSKVNPSEFYIGYIEEIIPNIKIHLIDSQNRLSDLNEKYPYVMYKIVNGKLYKKLNNAINHLMTKHLYVLANNTYIILQPPTYPIIRVIAELISEITSSENSETILIITNQLEGVYARLSEIGFKILKVDSKLRIDEKNFVKAQFICIGTPETIGALALKNYHFTRVIVQGANQIDESLILLALDKGCEVLYLIGDNINMGCHLRSPYAKNRLNQSHDMITRLLPLVDNFKIRRYMSQLEPHLLHPSMIRLLQKYFYPPSQLFSLSHNYEYETPLIKGFPWPSQNLNTRIAFINHTFTPQNSDYYLNRTAQLSISIINSIINSGFIDYKDIGCRIIDDNLGFIISNKLFQQKGFREKSMKKEIKMVDKLTGSRFKQKDLVICLLVNKRAYQQVLKSKQGCCQMQLGVSCFNAGLQQNRRGLFVIGDLSLLYQADRRWLPILLWANKNKIVLNYQI